MRILTKKVRDPTSRRAPHNNTNTKLLVKQPAIFAEPLLALNNYQTEY